jgi:hypothetical protein
MTDSSESIASLRAWKEAHEDRCKERFDANARDLGEIKAAIQYMSADLKETVKRIHERNEITATAISDTRSMAATEIVKVNQRIDSHSIKTLLAILAGIGGFATAISEWILSHIGVVPK